MDVNIHGLVGSHRQPQIGELRLIENVLTGMQFLNIAKMETGIALSFSSVAISSVAQ
jgi:hypothetical protein